MCIRDRGQVAGTALAVGKVKRAAGDELIASGKVLSMQCDVLAGTDIKAGAVAETPVRVDAGGQHRGRSAVDAATRAACRKRGVALRSDDSAVVDVASCGEPVSYTHLDVYKRQVRCPVRGCFRQ